MRDELLNYLKSSIARNWLHYDGDDAALIDRENYSSLLYRRTQAKLAQIRDISAPNEQNLAVLVAENEPLEFIAAFLAGIIAEVHLFLGNSDWQQREWQQVLDLVKPDWIFGTAAISRINKLTPSASPSLAETERPLIMIPTGGTSGKIKFAMHSWSTLTASVSGFKQFFGCQTINSWCTLPLYHVSGLMQLMRSLVTQGNLVIADYRTTNINIDPSTYFISLVPTQLEFLLASHPQWLQRFKTVLVGGAPARRLLLETAKRFKIAIAPIYGSTETASGVVALKPTEFWAGNLSNGRPLPHAQISILTTSEIDVDTTVNAASDRHWGLISIDSTSLFKGYYPQLLPSTRPLVTDDLGYLDEQGYLHLLGRNSHKIITGGENVFPPEVEAAIYATQLVDDVCVLGIPDRYWGQAVTAIYVTKNANNNLSEIQCQLQSQLAKYKQPKHWLQLERLPRNSRGKIDYRQLREIAIAKINSIKNHEH